MKWEKDLVVDIKTGDDELDDQDGPFTLDGRNWSDIDELAGVALAKEKFLSVRDHTRSILEIGVNQFGFTRTWLDNKHKGTTYVGIDVEDRSYLNDPSKLTWTIHNSSSKVDDNMVKINDKWVGKVEKITWRATFLVTGAEETLIVPNLMLANAVIVNLATPDSRMRRNIEVVIDYDTSVESAERILYAAALGAVGVTYVGSPAVMARRMERDGVVYNVGFTISSYTDGMKSDHAVIKNIVQCMRDAGITVTFPKSEVIHTPRRARIADRSLDTLRLVQQCRVFRSLPAPLCERIAGVLIERYFVAGAAIVKAGERRDSLFIVGEGMVKRILTDRDGAHLLNERFIATEAFGLRALFSAQPQVATVTAETAVLVYEFERRALAAMLAADASLADTLASSLAHLAWRDSKDSVAGVEPEPAVIDRLTNLFRGRIHAAYLLEAPVLGNEAARIHQQG